MKKRIKLLRDDLGVLGVFGRDPRAGHVLLVAAPLADLLVSLGAAELSAPVRVRALGNFASHEHGHVNAGDVVEVNEDVADSLARRGVVVRAPREALRRAPAAYGVDPAPGQAPAPVTRPPLRTNDELGRGGA